MTARTSAYEASLNPYRGCEHGCIYCYARPTHEYLGFSSGLDFETKIMVKEDAPRLLRQELSSPRWVPKVIALSGVTDPYQPVERRLKLTRACLEVLAEFRNPVTDRDQEQPGDPRPGLAGRVGELPGRCRVYLAYHARRQAEENPGAAHLAAGSAPGDHHRAGQGGHSRRRVGCASDPGADRPRDSGGHRRGRGGWCDLRSPYPSAPAACRGSPLRGMADAATCPARRTRFCIASAPSGGASSTTPSLACG